MADISVLTTFPGQVDNATSMTQFCRVEVVTIDVDEEDSDLTIEDIQSPSMYRSYQSPTVEDDEDTETLCVALTFYTESGETSRYIQDLQSDDASDVLARVLCALGQKGWQAMDLLVDDEYGETWYLQRITRR